MNITISENLRKLRKQKENTQEDLAEYLGISIQAVSKWERHEGYPDITFLPAIASFYETSVDNLLGCGEIEQNKKISEYITKYESNSNSGKIEDNILLMRNALHEFPNDLDIMHKLMHSLFYSEKDKYLEEGIILGEKVLLKSTCDQQRYEVIQSLVYSYNRKNMTEKAIEYADRLPDMFCTRDIVLEAVLEGEKLQKLTQINICKSLGLIDMSVISMLRSKKYTPEEKVFAFETVINLYKLFIYDENYEHINSALYMLWINNAKAYAELKNNNKVINALKQAQIHAKAMDSFISGKYTSIFADTVEYTKGMSKNFEYSYITWFKKTTKNTVFDFIRESAEFKILQN